MENELQVQVISIFRLKTKRISAQVVIKLVITNWVESKNLDVYAGEIQIIGSEEL